MKKLILFSAMFLFSLGVFAQGNELLGYVPANVDGFASINMKELSSHPKIKEMLDKNEDKEFNKFKEDLKASGIDIYNTCTTGVVFMNVNTKKAGAIFKTSVNEETFNKVIQSRIQDGSMTKSVCEGKNVYTLAKGTDKTSIVYLKPDIVGVSDLPEDAVKLGSLSPADSVTSNTKLMDLASKADKDSPMWAVFVTNIPPPKGKQDPMQQMIPFDNIQGGIVNLKFTGDAKDTANLNIRLNCKEKTKAQILTIQLQAMVLAIIPNIAQGNQQLSEQFMKAMKFTNEENDIVISAEITPALQEELKKFAEANAANAMGGQMPGAQPPMKKKKTPPKAASPDEPGVPPPPPPKAQ